jgi:hypothetical protein
MSLSRPGDFSPYKNSLKTDLYTLMADFTYSKKFLTLRWIFKKSLTVLVPFNEKYFKTGLWIRIDLLRIRIQHFSQSGYGSGSKLKQNFRRQFLSQNFLKSKLESNKIKNTCVIHQKVFQKVLSAILYFFSGKFFLNN